MARYTVRVELHEANQNDYEDLHDYMQQEGFRRYITDDKGKKYQLPTAEYNIDDPGNKNAVLAKTRKAAARTYKEYMVLVTTSGGRAWHNLPVWKGK